MSYLILIAMIIALDQVSKYLVVLRLEKVNSLPIINGILHFTIVKNSGAAFSILRNKQKLLFIITFPIIIILSVYLFIFIKNGEPFLLNLALSFIIGGAIGNLIDRVRLKYVVDFIHFKFKRFPVFNIADFFIFIGAIIIMYVSIST